MRDHVLQLVGSAVAIACWVWSVPASAQSAYLVEDINTKTNGRSSKPGSFVPLGNIAYFTAWDPEHGRELWKTDGTAQGTLLATDALSGADSPEDDPDYAATRALGGTILFAASRSETGVELWRSNGELNGTRLVRDIRPGPESSTPGAFTVVGDVMFFVADDGTHGAELWRTDGTEEGTRIVVDLSMGPASSSPQALTAVGGALVFQQGSQLWRTAGTAESTYVLSDLHPRASLEPMARPGTFLDFRQGIDAGLDLWITDGTVEGTVQVDDDWTWDSGVIFAFDLFPSVDVAGTLIFAAPSVSCPGGSVLWRSDLADPTTVVEGASCTPVGRAMGLTKNGIVLHGFDEYGPGIFRTTETLDRTELLVRLDGATSAVTSMVSVNDGVAFLVFGDGASLWKSDGTAAGTGPVSELFAVDTDARLCAIGDGVVFADDDGAGGRELWHSDLGYLGSGDAKLLRDIAPAGHSSKPEILGVTSSGLSFRADDGEHGMTLWTTDGTAVRMAATEDAVEDPVDDLVSRAAWVERSAWTTYVLEQDPSGGTKLWFIDEPSRAIVEPPLEWYAPDGGVAHALIDGILYFALHGGNRDSPSHSLWRTDGTWPGTHSIKDLDAPVWQMWNLQGTLVLMSEPVDAMGTPAAPQLWEADGTADGTKVVWSLESGTSVREIAGRLLVLASSGVDVGTWSFDPRAAGPLKLSDRIFSVADGTADRLFALVQPVEGVSPGSLWRSDWTADGTTMVAQLPGTAMWSLRLVDCTAFFVTYDAYAQGDGAAPYGTLWASDSTKDELVRLHDSEEYFDITVAPGIGVAFVGTTAEHGSEPWTSDGSPEGTRMVRDIAPGPRSSTSSAFVSWGDKLFFVADDGERGAELWAISPEPAPAADEGCACSLPSRSRRVPAPPALLFLMAAARAARRRRRPAPITRPSA